MSSARESTAGGRHPTGGWAVLALAVAAVAASWNPIGAPFGLFVGVGAALVAGRALRRRSARRSVVVVALGLAVLAAVASGVVLAMTAGAIGTDLPGQPVVKGRTNAELEEVLDGSKERTRVARQRAAGELDKLGRPAPGRDRRSAPDDRIEATGRPQGAAP